MKTVFAAVLLVVASASAKRSNGVREMMLESNRPAKTSAQETTELLLGNTCDDCKAMVEMVARYSENPMYIEVAKEGIKAFCHEVFSGDNLNACIQFADRLPEVIGQIKPLLNNPDKFCEMLSLCGSHRSRVSQLVFMAAKRQVFKMTLSAEERNTICDECKFAVAELRTVWEQKSIQKEVEDLLESTCTALGQYADMCKTLVEQYWKTLSQFIDDELKDANAACSQIGLCGTRMTTVRGQRLFPALDSNVRLHHPRDSVLVKLVRRLGQTQSAAGNKAGCTACLVSFTTLIDALEFDRSILESVAREIQTRVVAVLPAAYGPSVTDFLAQYLLPVLQLTVKQVTPRQICNAISACDADAYVPALRPKTRMTMATDGVLICESCKLLSEALAGELSQADVQKEIQDELMQICNFVPGSVADECDSLITENLPVLLKTLIDYFQPNSFCPSAGFCAPEAREFAKPAENIQDEVGY